MSQVERFMQNHWVQFIGLVFLSGSFYARFLLLETEFKDHEILYREKIENIRTNLNLKIEKLEKELKETDERVRDIERHSSL